MVTETRRAWLAGIVDGEGSIALFHNQEKNGSDKIRPVLNIVNTDIGIVNEVLKILEECGCNPYIVKRQHKNPNHKTIYEVKTTSVTQIKKWLTIIEPYLFGEKKHKAQVLLRYCSRREEKFKVGDRSYTPDDWGDLEDIRSSQTTRETPGHNCQVMI